MKKLFLALICLLFCSQAYATTYYVRMDGSTDTNCTGTTDAPYPGSGTGQPCAYSHPFYAQRINGSSTAGLFAGGDTLIIDGNNYGFITASGRAEYKIGANAPTTGVWSGTRCGSSGDTYNSDCFWYLPGGPDASHPTKILGKGWDTGTGPKPILWGANGLYAGVIMLGDEDNFEIQYLEITDHAACGGSDTSSWPCTHTNGLQFANYGIHSAGGSNNTLLKNLNIHGMALGCGVMSKASNWRFENITCRGEGFVGWEGDRDEGGQSGKMTVRTMLGEYIGCVEDYPDTSKILGCQGQGFSHLHGYGDMFGFDNGQMADWDIDGLTCQYTTQDCFDGAHGIGGSTTSIKNSIFQHINGQAVKIREKLIFENNIIVHDCGWMASIGPMDTGGYPGDTILCRAGATFSMAPANDVVNSITGNTIFSNADIMFYLAGTCNANTKMTFRNNIIYGGKDFIDDNSNPNSFNYPSGGGNDSSDFYYTQLTGCSDSSLIDEDYDRIYGTKGGAADVTGAHSSYGDPGVVGTIKTGPYTSGYYTSVNPYLDFRLPPASPISGLGYQSGIAICVSDGSCSASMPLCGKTTTGTDNCGSTCFRQGPACPVNIVKGVRIGTSSNYQYFKVTIERSNLTESLPWLTLTTFEKWLTTTTIQEAK